MLININKFPEERGNGHSDYQPEIVEPFNSWTKYLRNSLLEALDSCDCQNPEALSSLGTLKPRKRYVKPYTVKSAA